MFNDTTNKRVDRVGSETLSTPLDTIEASIRALAGELEYSANEIRT